MVEVWSVTCCQTPGTESTLETEKTKSILAIAVISPGWMWSRWTTIFILDVSLHTYIYIFRTEGENIMPRG
jgi:hypothetical protein